MTKSQIQRVLAAATATTAVLAIGSTAARAQITVDGTRDAAYGNAFAVQTVNTGFGDNQSELDAGYVRIENGRMYMMLTGNIESNFNKLVLFFDTRAGGQNVMRNDNPDVEFNNLNFRYNGMTHDAGFAPDYIMWFTRGLNTTTNEYEVFANFSELNTNGGGFGAFLGRLASPAPTQTVSGTFGGTGGAPLVEFGYNDSNTAGVIGDPAGSAADQTAAAAVTTGSEFSIELPQIGATENFQAMIGINGSSHDFWSNQFLPGLTPPQGNLGGDGLGNFVEPGGPGTGGTVGLVNFNNIAGNQFLTLNYHAPLSQWNNPASGNWNLGGNWTGDGVPNAIDARAVLGTAAGSAPRTVTLDTPVRLASLTFDSTGGYTVAGSNTLTIAGNPAMPAVLVNAGSHTISAPVVLGATTNFTVATGATLSVTGPFTATGQAVVKAGPGLLAVPHFSGTSLNVAEGTARLTSGGSPGTTTVSSLIIAGGEAPTATLDITNGALVVDYTGGPNSPFQTIKTQIISAYNNGSWNGTGITSSNANNTNFGIGYAEAASLTTVPPIFGTVDTEAVLARLTRYGDANLDGQVNLSDFNALASNFGGSDKQWIQGDFNYDGIVNLSDFNRLAANFGLQAGPDGPTPDDWAALAAVVPEPSSLGLFGLAASALIRRRRR
jgi:hypothetical protein